MGFSCMGRCLAWDRRAVWLSDVISLFLWWGVLGKETEKFHHPRYIHNSAKQMLLWDRALEMVLANVMATFSKESLDSHPEMQINLPSESETWVQICASIYVPAHSPMPVCLSIIYQSSFFVYVCMFTYVGMCILVVCGHTCIYPCICMLKSETKFS